MLDRSKIMKRAWAIYREEIAFARYEGRERFGHCLKSAWNKYYHEQMREFYAERSNVIAGCSPIEHIKYDIAMLPYKSSRIDIAAQRQHLEAKLERIAA